MMFPLLPAGLALAARILTSKFNSPSFSQKGKTYGNPKKEQKRIQFKVPKVTNPIQTLVNGLTSTITKITNNTTDNEDDRIVVKHFLPDKANLLSPKYPSNSKTLQYADVDGDLQNELIASYRSNDEVKTLVLKKQNGQWQKAYEIDCPDCESIHYRGLADITGEGKKQLLLGLSSKRNASVLHGYSISNGTANKVFSQKYHKLEVLPPSTGKRKSANAELAVWDKKDNKINVDVMNWNGSNLEHSDNSTAYHYNNVAPYFAQKIKRSPYNSAHWYNFANSLVRSGLYSDASDAIEVGMALDSKASLKTDFEALKNEIDVG